MEAKHALVMMIIKLFFLFLILDIGKAIF